MKNKMIMLSSAVVLMATGCSANTDNAQNDSDSSMTQTIIVEKIQPQQNVKQSNNDLGTGTSGDDEESMQSRLERGQM